MERYNQSGNISRSPSDNKVIKSGGMVDYEGNRIYCSEIDNKWILNGNFVGSISNLCKALGHNVETHYMGFWLEGNGYKFRKPFE